MSGVEVIDLTLEEEDDRSSTSTLPIPTRKRTSEDVYELNFEEEAGPSHRVLGRGNQELRLMLGGSNKRQKSIDVNKKQRKNIRLDNQEHELGNSYSHSVEGNVRKEEQDAEDSRPTSPMNIKVGEIDISFGVVVGEGDGDDLFEHSDTEAMEMEDNPVSPSPPPPVLTPELPLPVSMGCSTQGRDNKGAPQAISDINSTKPVKERKTNSRFTQKQTEELRKAFSRSQKIENVAMMLDLIEATGLEKPQIQRWFCREFKKQTPQQGRQQSISAAGKCNRTSTNRSSSSSSFSEQRQRSQSNRGQNPAQDQRSNQRVAQPRMSFSSDGSNNENNFTERAIEHRVEVLKQMGVDEIEAALREKKCHQRVKALYDMYSRNDDKKRLLTETRHLEEHAAVSVNYFFRKEHLKKMETWRAGFLEAQISQLPTDEDDEESAEKIVRLGAANLRVIKVWLPMIVYGILLNVRITRAMKEFTFHERARLQIQESVGDYMDIARCLHYFT